MRLVSQIILALLITLLVVSNVNFAYSDLQVRFYGNGVADGKKQGSQEIVLQILQAVQSNGAVELFDAQGKKIKLVPATGK